MSTQLRFDIDGFRRAIESGDARYQLALYADDAELNVVDPDDPFATPHVLHGKPAIGSWIEQLHARSTGLRVVDLRSMPDRVELTEEVDGRDGSHVAYGYSAEVRRGQLVRTTLTRLDRASLHDEGPPSPETT